MKLFFITLFLVLSISGFGQTDTTYIQKLPNKKILSSKLALSRFRVTFRTDETEPIFFENYSLKVGLRFKFKKFGLGFSVPITSFNPSGNLGKTKSFGLNIGIYPKSYFLQLDFRNHRGMNNLNLLESQPSQVFREDMRVVFGSIFFAYLFNSDKLSLRSAFKMIDKQKRSAGSWLISGIAEYHALNADSLNLPIFVQTGAPTNKYRSYKGGIGGGYAYSWVAGNWTTTGMLSLSGELRRLEYQGTGENNSKRSLRVDPRCRLFASVNYNTEHFFYGVSGDYIPGILATNGLNTKMTNLTLRFSVGWRFF